MVVITDGLATDSLDRTLEQQPADNANRTGRDDQIITSIYDGLHTQVN